MTARRFKTNYSIDWVELGARGWDIDQYGAWYDPAESMQHAFVNRYGHQIGLDGSPAFLAARLADLLAAGVNCYPDPTCGTVAAESASGWPWPGHTIHVHLANPRIGPPHAD